MAYIATTDISDSSVSLSIVNQVRLYIAVYYDSWKGRKLICLAMQRPVSNAVCLSGKLQPMVYAPSHTQSGYIYSCRLTDGPWRC